MPAPERNHFLALRRQGVPQWEAFRMTCEKSGRDFSHSTCALWERWYRAELGLPAREPDPRRSLVSRDWHPG